jgi:glutathione synthase/RimK-type ligase-like ATP-grasp enzyme
VGQKVSTFCPLSKRREVLPVLIITNQFDPHVDYVIEKFHARDVPFVRLNTDDIPAPDSLLGVTDSEGGFELALYKTDAAIAHRDIGAIWYRRPGEFQIPALDEESRRFARQEIRELVHGWWSTLSNHKWINDPFAIDRARHKVLQLQMASALRFSLPRTLITTDPQRFAEFWRTCHGNVVYKALGHATSRDDEGRYCLTPTRLLDESFMERLEGIRVAPCIFQEYVAKKFELRITVIEGRVFTCAIHSQGSQQSRIDWRMHPDPESIQHTVYELPLELQHRCIDLTSGLGLRSGMIDMIVTPSNEYVFLEINPNGQWVWVEEMTGLPISEALLAALTTPGT